VDRWELSVELLPDAAPNRGSGRALIGAGLAMAPADEWVWAQVAAGNTASLRAFLAAGFVPVCSEVLFSRHAD
jgi:L-amino acid N-acyltransferase YncA